MSFFNILGVAMWAVLLLLWGALAMVCARRFRHGGEKAARIQAQDAVLRLRRLVDHAPDPIFVHDLDGRLIDVNEAACRHLGYTREELLGMAYGDFDAGQSLAEVTAAWPRLAAGESLRLEGQHRRKDGSIVPVEIAAAATSTRGPRITAMCRDVSERLEHERALERAIEELSQAQLRAEAAVTAKNNFLESASYKIRTPLNTILGLSEMIAAGVCGKTSNAKVDEYLADIHAAGLDLLTVIDELAHVAAAEAAVSADQRSYRTIIEMSPDSICLCRKGTITFINSAGVRLLGGYDADQMQGQPLAQFVHPDYRVLCEDDFAPLVGEAAGTPMKFLHSSGKILDVVVSAATAPEGDGDVLVVARNISDVTRATRDLAEQAKRLNSILDSAVDAIVVTDQQGCIETFNRAAETMFGYAAAEAIGQRVTILMTEADISEHQSQIERHVGSSNHPRAFGIGREVTARRRDGTIFPAEVSLSVCQLDDRRLFTAMIHDITERRNFEDHLAHSASHDALTGLPNRRLLQERLPQALDRAESDGSWIAVWFIDLDGFKTVNDVMGHAAGDQLLIEAGKRMLAALKPGDTVARFGGDEFTVVVTGIHSHNEVVEAIEHFLDALSRPFTLGGREVTLTANVGIALYPEHGRLASELVMHAGAAMIFAKANGRNLYRFFDPSMHDQSAERLTMENELRRGIERGELILHYQPQVDVQQGRIVGLEALVRWNHPIMGMVSPGRFIPIAEQTGLIVPLGEWVVRQAGRDLRRLEDAGINDVSIAVNISARQFSDTDVLSLIDTVIEENAIHATQLDVEITESMLMNDPEHVIAYLKRMKALGIRLSIDDFGTGYSSLNYLKRFPVDTLKIDRSFVIDIAENPKDEAIAVTIITLAHSMGMNVLAEGVEYPQQSEILRRHGCDIIQGFLYGKPMPLDKVMGLLDTPVPQLV